MTATALPRPKLAPGGAAVALVVSAFGVLVAGAAVALAGTPVATVLPPGVALASSVLWTRAAALPAEPWSRAWTATVSAGLAAGLGVAMLVPVAWAALAPGVAAAVGVGWLAARSGRMARAAEANLWGWLFAFPAVLLLVVWQFGPAMFALGMSFFDRVNFVREAPFAGLSNYAFLLRDPLFWQALLNSFWYTVGTVPVGILIATLVAILLNENVRGQGLLRTVYFLPYVTALTAAAAVWRWIYNPEFGLLNALLGTPGLDWLNTPVGLFEIAASPLRLDLPVVLRGPSVALTAVMAMSVWHQLGYSVVILLAGLQSIPREYYEAASLDGASWWQQVRRITWPLLGPTTFFLAVTGLIGAFQVFTQILVLTPNGGVLGDTTTIVKYLYDKGFRDNDYSYASAMAFALFVIVVVATLAQQRALSRRVTYDL